MTYAKSGLLKLKHTIRKRKNLQFFKIKKLKLNIRKVKGYWNFFDKYFELLPLNVQNNVIFKSISDYRSNVLPS